MFLLEGLVVEGFDVVVVAVVVRRLEVVSFVFLAVFHDFEVVEFFIAAFVGFFFSGLPLVVGVGLAEVFVVVDGLFAK